jgi:hypothetical protein
MVIPVFAFRNLQKRVQQMIMVVMVLVCLIMMKMLVIVIDGVAKEMVNRVIRADNPDV